tara:strand:+ start:1002 stop:2837 length:1836 start_codon:yes stop_codon:yes gene_type:complete
MNRLLGIVFLILFSKVGFAQLESDLKLADHYYSQGEYDKARPYYEAVYKTNPSKIYLTRLLSCLEAEGDLKQAERVLKKAKVKSPADLDLKIQLAVFYEEHEAPSKAKKAYESLLENFIVNPSKGIALFNAFVALSKIDYAERVLQISQKEFKNYPFHFQQADLYSLTNRKGEMVSTYLTLLDKHDYYDKSVRKLLLRRLDLTDEQTEDFKLLKKVLFEKAQKVNSSVVFSELLIWMYMQVDNFSGVYSQVVSVDLRSKANGQRLFDFAKTCTENKDYSTALRAFEEARLLTTNRELKFYSLEGILHVGYIQISDLKKHTDEELQKVLKNYEEALQSIGPITSRTLRVLLEYAELLAFYAEQKDKALEVIKEAYSAVSLTDMMRSELKMLQADIELLKGNVWEASLLYMQISEAFNFESIGNLAKFKSARIFYYEGEFEFAQSQLDVLKQSTSKLLSNDALELSIMITDNYGLDSNYIAMAWFSKADLYIEQLQFDKAFSLFDSIRTNYPFHALADEILYKRARAMELQGNWQLALGFYSDIIKFHGTDILADNAIFKSAELMETKLGQSSEALKRYKQLLSDHPGSLYIHETRKRVRRLRGEKIEKEDEF